MKRIIGMLLALMAIGMISCNNDKNDVPDLSEGLALKSAEINMAEVQAEAATTEVEYEVEFFSNAEEKLANWYNAGRGFGIGKLRYRLNQCPDVTIKGHGNEEYPKTIKLDYGKGKELKNGKVLSGSIEIVISAPRKSKNYTREVSYKNFGVDTLTINGSSKVEVDRVNEMFRKFSSVLNMELPDGTKISRESERYWQWLSGEESDDDQEDDVVTITGWTEATVIWAEGGSDTYRKEIVDALERKMGCKYVTAGTVKVWLGTQLISTMDYGYSESDDDCDQFAKLETEEGTEVIDLSERKRKKEQKREQKREGK